MYTKEQIAEAGLDDFRVFLAEVWAHLALPSPTLLQYSIAFALQHGPRRLMIQAFRGVGKSWITVAFVLWTLLLDPQKKIMVVSANEDMASDFTTFCLRLIREMPLLQHLKPGRHQRESALSFDVGPSRASKDPSVYSVGITGQLTGHRADLIIPDDVEIPKNSQTHVLRERLAELVKEFDSLIKPGGRVIYLGTPQVEASLYNRLTARGYTVRIWPSEIPSKIEQYAGKLSQFILNLISEGAKPLTPTDGVRFSREDLDERLASYGRSGYALQFMLDTSLSDADRTPLKLRDLIVQDVDAEKGHVKLVWGRDKDLVLQDLHAGGLEGDLYHRPAWKSDEMAMFTQTVMAIDPSGKGSDETAFAIIRFLHGQLYLVKVGGFRDGFSEATLEALAAAAARHGVNTVIIERNYGGGMFDALLLPHLAKVSKARIDDEWNSWSSGQKELRILDTLEPLVQSHRLTVDRRVIEDDAKVQQDTPRYSFVQQFSRLERVKGCLPNEDRVEAVGMACSYFTTKMDRDKDKALEQHKEDALDAELREFMEEAGVNTTRNRRVPVQDSKGYYRYA